MSRIEVCEMKIEEGEIEYEKCQDDKLQNGSFAV
jgi:hypothetical protein